MPSQTFYNLPAEKREKLLRAAREEFGRVPFAQASINRMIQAAGIPRGSFYMYFSGKEELFTYLLSSYMERLHGRIRQALERRAGDLFAALEDLMDEAVAARGDAEASETLALLRRNAGAQQGGLFQSLRVEGLEERLGSWVDPSRLDLRTPEDLGHILHILVGVTAPALCAAVFGDRPEEVRARYRARLEILKRGMEAPKH